MNHMVIGKCTQGGLIASFFVFAFLMHSKKIFKLFENNKLRHTVCVRKGQTIVLLNIENGDILQVLF